MFDVPALLLDGRTFKCVDTEVVLLSVVGFRKLDTSSVETHLRRGEIFSDSIMTNFLLILTVNKSLKIGQYLIRRTNNVPIFGPPGISFCITYLGRDRVTWRVTWSMIRTSIKHVCTSGSSDVGVGGGVASARRGDVSDVLKSTI